MRRTLLRYNLLLRDATASPSWVKNYRNVGPRNTSSTNINNLLSPDDFFSTKKNFCFRITMDNTGILLNLYLTVVKNITKYL